MKTALLVFIALISLTPVAAQVDYAVAYIMVPKGLVGQHDSTIPRAGIRNFGIGQSPYWLFFFVRDSFGQLVYAESVYVDTVSGPSLPKMCFTQLGRYDVVCSLYCREDLIRTNDWISGVFWVVPRPGGEIVVKSFDQMPQGLTDTLTNWVPTVTFINLGTESDSAGVALLFSDSANIIYADTHYIYLQVGQELQVRFHPIRFTTLGRHYGWLTIFFPNYDSTGWEFTVVPCIGIVEMHLTPLAEDITPTFARYVFNLSSETNNQYLVVAFFDATGRRVLNLNPGANDIRHLAPGVYFIKEKNGIKRKVVIAR